MEISSTLAQALSARGFDVAKLRGSGAINSIREDGECWTWIGRRLNNGYGQLRQTTAHRAIFVLLGGTITPGLELDHVCRNKLCVNPLHLEPVSRAENIRRRSAAKTACAQGHPWLPENITVERRGTRRCRECHRLAEKARYAARRAAQ